jgi:hypothetical protein
MEGSMPRSRILSAILVVAAAAVVLTARTSFSEPRAQECHAAPGSSTPRGAHWYYRINHTDKQHCWYLGTPDARSSGPRATSLTSTPALTRQKRSEAEAAPAAPSQAASAEGAFLQQVPGAREGQTVLVAHWPENLSKAHDLSAQSSTAHESRTDPAAASNSYPESDAETDAAVQVPLRWPIVEDDRTEQISLVERVLRSFSIVGGLFIAALLLAGWAARFVRGHGGWPIADRWQKIIASLSPRRRAVFAEIVDGMPAETHHGAGQAGAPTDPARDLKTSLAELMRDLQRAEVASGPGRSSKRQTSGRGRAAHRQALQAAE